jgi:DNA-directed RNA polymerase subunit beta'
MGAESLLTVISKINLAKLATELATEFRKSSGAKHLKIAKRLRLVEGMRKAKVSPSWLIIKILPVIPPDLRPMVQLTGGRFATSDLNDLYRRVINRNNRLKHLMDLGAPEIILRNEKRMLQEAVDNLIDSSRWVAGRRTKTPVLRSLSDMLRGKQGRFRQNLLGKRVDYSGRSVIVVGPELSLDQCGLPKEMALEMFKPYVLREMILRGVAPNVRSAKNILERKPAEIFDILEEITRNHPVLLNRAPTLHKLGIQAFYPVLVEGSAIRLHPCVCAGFNADFDGDQMAVHIPLSEEACQEAKNLMMARHNLLKPSDGSPISIPDAKEMAVGVYYLTSADPLLPPAETVFADKDEAILACQTGKIKLRQPIKVRLAGEILETTTGRLLFNEVLPKKLGFLNESVRRAVTKSLFARAFRACTNEEIVNLIDNVKNLGFEAGTVSGHSLSIFNCQKLPEKDKIIARAEGEVVSIEKNFNQGLITEQEKRRLTQEVWIAVTEELAEKTWASFTPENPVKMVMDAGVGRVSKDQVKQLSAMRGLGVDPLGKIVPLPVKSNFRDGLGAFEFVAGARSSRKGLTDTALKTADAGYLTRRLVDVAHGAIIREKDCQTEKGLEVSREGPRAKVFFNRLLGRLTASPVTDPKTKKVLLAKGAQITEEALGILEKAGVEKVFVRSLLTCQTRHGLCAACYGWDFANKKMVEVGTPVGVLAAQSIGEPGTQLTLRTRHVGGVVGLDVTQGLPRVEELFEVRLPKTPSPLAEVSGKVSIRQTDEGFELKIKDKAYLLPPTSNLLVEDDQKIEAGAQLASGTLDIREILRVKGLRAAQEYLLAEVQAVYESQGIPINDKHFEVIIGCMSQKVRIVEPGETEFLPGELVDKLELAKAAKGKKVVAEEIILGLTRASILTNSWLSAASFQETTNVLTEAALKSKEDPLLGLKENVIIGRLIPTSPERAKIKTGS